MDFTQAKQDIQMIKEVKLFNAGYVKKFDFSMANSCEEARIEAVTMIANVCRGDKGVKDREKLYQQLLTEHDGKPGEVFQFIPVEADITNPFTHRNMIKYGTLKWSWKNPLKLNIKTNMRAMLADNKNYYNKKVTGFFVPKIKIPMMIVQHILRHGQLSFMQVSERTQKLRDHYFCKELQPILDEFPGKSWDETILSLSTNQIDDFQKKYKIRQELLNKSEWGLRYCTMWLSAWEQDPSQWDNFFAVRTKNPTQAEMQTLAKTMKEMIDE